MRTLHLLRHAKSSWENPNLPGFDRPLGLRGFLDKKKWQAFYQSKLLEVDVCFSSPSMRTVQTIDGIVDTQKIVFIESLYEATAEGLFNLVQNQKDAYPTLLLCGHNPGFEILANGLLANLHILKFPTFGLLTIRFEIESWTDLRYNIGIVESFYFPKGMKSESKILKPILK